MRIGITLVIAVIACVGDAPTSSTPLVRDAGLFDAPASDAAALDAGNGCETILLDDFATLNPMLWMRAESTNVSPCTLPSPSGILCSLVNAAQSQYAVLQGNRAAVPAPKAGSALGMEVRFQVPSYAVGTVVFAQFGSAGHLETQARYERTPTEHRVYFQAKTSPVERSPSVVIAPGEINTIRMILRSAEATEVWLNGVPQGNIKPAAITPWNGAAQIGVFNEDSPKPIDVVSVRFEQVRFLSCAPR
jgi:hypothetical protein